MSFKLTRLESVVVAAAEPEEAMRTWQRTLGLETASESRMTPRLRLGDAFLEMAAATEGEQEGLRALVIEVEGLDEAVAHLRAQGVAVSEVGGAAGRRAGWVDRRSSHGVPICLVEATAGQGSDE